MRSWEPQGNAIRIKEKVERRPDRVPDVRHPEKVERQPNRILDVRYPEEVERRRTEFQI